MDPTEIITDSPTLAMEAGTEVPTLQPTVPAENDQCAGAESISFGETLQGSTIESMDFAFDDCGSAQGGNSSAPSRWYIAQGTGEEMMVFVNATYDVQIAVYGGSDCDSLTCIGGTEAFPPDFNVGYLTFPSVADETYYVLVSGFAGAVGLYDLTVTVPEILDNDQCSGALEIILGDPISGSTIFATMDDGAAKDYCTSFNRTSPGIWYTIAGTGGRLQATILESNFGPQISVFSGSCIELTCVGGEVASISYQVPPLLWETETDETYYVYIHGVASMVGDFELLITEPDIPENDVCDAATELAIPTTRITGTTVGATLENNTRCGRSVLFRPCYR